MNETIISNARRTALAYLDGDKDCINAYLTGGQRDEINFKLTCLTTLIGTLAGASTNPDWTRCNLKKIYGYTAGWLTTLGVKNVQAGISAARDEQNVQLASGRTEFTGAGKVDPVLKIRLMVEQLGNVAAAIDFLEVLRTDVGRANGETFLSHELLQLAAVAVAWLENFETK